MANKSREQKQACVQAIIELTREKGRLTVKEAIERYCAIARIDVEVK